MLISVLVFTFVGSFVASKVPNTTMGGFSTVMTLFLGIKFIVRPVMTTKESMQAVSEKKRFMQSVISGVLVGFICGFIGAGGGMMMLLILTSVLGYELKTAVGTSVFMMTFSAFTGAASHFLISGMPDMLPCPVRCIYAAVGARRGKICKQSKSGNIKPCDRRCLDRFGRCHFACKTDSINCLPFFVSTNKFQLWQKIKRENARYFINHTLEVLLFY